jgi:hypothetical protein
MEITAKFNNGEEMIAFAKLLLGNGVKNEEVFTAKIPHTPENIKEEIKKEVKVDKTVDVTPKVEVDVVGVDQTAGETKDGEIVEDKKKGEPKVTKEMVRATFTKLIKAGKQKEAKELTIKYGAAKLPEVKEEDYSAILKEAEELL